MSQGYLSIETRIADGGLPLPNTKIYINPSGRGSEVSDTFYSYYLKTDSSGNTGFIRIDTPEKYLSTNINNQIPPYSLVDVYAISDGFYPTRIKKVQVFSDTQSILPIKMIPISQSYAGSTNGTVNYTVPPSTLITQDIPKADNITPDEASPLIAEQIYIPENITVHLGTPSSDAPNVTVPFTEYVKNVASSEIYPTWPEESLKANIYAIISLTLNRIFTEWYRGRGYDFDITSTTAYDQSFVPGRNIFENISEIVDDVFNTYVTREGYVNPLFTTFCDGKEVSCNGLSQWGSVTLAQNGNSALDILKYYYGNDVVLTSTDKIESAQSSYPGTPLKLGDSGENVVTIQQQLMRIRQNYPAIPLIPTIDGRFGYATDSAVRVFQEIFDLQVDGIVGKGTWYKISQIYSSVSKLAETVGEGVSEIFSENVPEITISFGDSGNYVLLLQSLIDFISIFYPSIPAVVKDGIFGSATEDSVKQFQRTFELAETGIVNNIIWDALYKVYLNILESITPSLPPSVFPGRTLKRGDDGESVRIMQTYLNVISRIYTSIPPVAEDGIFGRDTENAVIAFQRAVRLPVTGEIDATTWQRITELYNFAT